MAVGDSVVASVQGFSVVARGVVDNRQARQLAHHQGQSLTITQYGVGAVGCVPLVTGT